MKKLNHTTVAVLLSCLTYFLVPINLTLADERSASLTTTEKSDDDTLFYYLSTDMIFDDGTTEYSYEIEAQAIDDYPSLVDTTDPYSWYQDQATSAEYGTYSDDVLRNPGDDLLADLFYIDASLFVYDDSVDIVIDEIAIEGVTNGYTFSDDFKSNGPSFDVDLFEQNIRDALDGNVVGYSYVINQSKQWARKDGVGWARTGIDGEIAQSEFKRMNIASISKTLTAVAVLQLLEKNGLSIDDPIEPWLPAEWKRGAGFSGEGSVKFKQLLNHTSGLNQAFNDLSDAEQASWGNDWDGLQFVVSNGTTPNSSSQYKNANYALFQMIIPALWKASSEDPGIGVLDEIESGVWYQHYLYDNLFEPIGVYQSSCFNSFQPDPTLLYEIDDLDLTGSDPGNWFYSCAHGGWVLSAYDLANLMANIRYNDEILSADNRALMDENRLGWATVYNGDYGEYLGHGGDLLYGDLDDAPTATREMHGCVMKFPIEVEAVLLVNSSNSEIGWTSHCPLLRDAFDNAWVD